MQDFALTLLEWLRSHSAWAGPLILVVAFAESLAVVGLIVPGVVLMFAAGAVAGAGYLSFWNLAAWAALGAVLGDAVSFYLGRALGPSLRRGWPLSRHPELLDRSVQFFRDHGAKSVLLGRFVGPIRPLIPAVAGMLHMPPRRFLLINVISALLWAPAYLLPGSVFGASISVAGSVLTRVLVLAGLLLVVGWCVYRVLTRLGQRLRPSWRRPPGAIWLVVGLVLAVLAGLTPAVQQRLDPPSPEWLPPSGDWRALAWRRLDAGPGPGEVLVAAAGRDLEAALDAAGWQALEHQGLRGALLWLAPAPRLRELPSPPVWWRGRGPDLQRVLPTDAHQRWLLRAWRTSLRLADGQVVWRLRLTRERWGSGLLWLDRRAVPASEPELSSLLSAL